MSNTPKQPELMPTTLLRLWQGDPDVRKYLDMRITQPNNDMAMVAAIHEIKTLTLRLKESQAQVAMWFKLQERRDSTATKLAAQISTECSKIRETISAMGRRPAGGGPG